MKKDENGHKEIKPLILSAGEHPKIAIIADVHGNLHALNAVMDDAKRRDAEIFLNAGDFLGYGAFPDEVVQKLSSENVHSIIGNYDLKVLRKEKKKKGGKIKKQKQISFDFAGENISETSIRFLRSLDREMRISIGDKSLLMVHGSPESVEEPLSPFTSEERLSELASVAGADVVIMGHSHRQFKREVDGVSFINPGSVGRPDDGDRRANYAILHTNSFYVDFIKLDYDVEGAADSIRASGLPENFAQMLLRGVSLDTIFEAEEEAMMEKRGEKERVYEKRVEQTREIAGMYDPDQEHSNTVRRLALELFDKLSDLHSLGEEERYWLECAAILHDIGWSQGPKGHHKSSLRLILNEQKFPFTSDERYIIGSIARYHRKAKPKNSHYHFAALSQEKKAKVRVLASFIRIADGLDASHAAVVTDFDPKIDSDCVTLVCFVTGDMSLESESVLKKKDLFESVIGRKVIVQWRQKN
ncbi:Exopolyphosphatase/pppGpp-phosphohydrolase/Predicted phosphodiesterase [Methanophagales archaeon]|nr:Exopolyphosphatase/pppGpp-phosphohydrolase/Predicted phosphodiesterase [Methanophagales archaeon]